MSAENMVFLGIALVGCVFAVYGLLVSKDSKQAESSQSSDKDKEA